LEESLNKRISELENVLKTLSMDNKAYKIAQEHNWLVYKDKLNELKEQIIRAWGVIEHNKEECMENRIVKEVLREDYQFKIAKLPDNELKAHYEGLLEKLDGKDSGGENDCKSCKYYISHVECCEKECLYYTDGQKLIAEFVEDLKYAVNSYLEVDTVTDKYIKILIEKWEARSK